MIAMCPFRVIATAKQRECTSVIDEAMEPKTRLLIFISMAIRVLASHFYFALVDALDG